MDMVNFYVFYCVFLGRAVVHAFVGQRDLGPGFWMLDLAI